MQQSLSFTKDLEENTNSTLTMYDQDESRLFQQTISDLDQTLNRKHQSLRCTQYDQTVINQIETRDLKPEKFSIKIKKSFKKEKLDKKQSDQFLEGKIKNTKKKPSQSKLSAKYENYIKKKLKNWGQKTTERFLRSASSRNPNKYYTSFCQIIQYSYDDEELAKISKQRNVKVYDLFRAKVTNFILSQSQAKQLISMKKKKLLNRRFIEIYD